MSEGPHCALRRALSPHTVLLRRPRVARVLCSLASRGDGRLGPHGRAHPPTQGPSATARYKPAERFLGTLNCTPEIHVLINFLLKGEVER